MKRHLAAAIPVLVSLALLFLMSVATPLAAMDLDGQLDEVRQLLKERDYSTALEDLRFIAQEIQELRLAEVRPLFPSPPPGWTAEEPVRTSREGELWSERLEVRRRYLPLEGSGRVEIVYDFNSPLITRVAVGLNPVYVALDPGAEVIELGGERGKLQFNGDTGEGELVLILRQRVLVSVIGRGVATRSVLRDFSALIDFSTLSTFSPP